jgi:hypothetical protein
MTDLPDSISLRQEEAKVETSMGPVILGLRRYVYDKRRSRHFDSGDRVWFGFDEDDTDRSKPILKESRQLAFELWTKDDSFDPLYVYLGRPAEPWERDLAIEFKDREPNGEWYRWSTGSEESNEDVGRIRKNYWCAAQAQVTVYRQSGDSGSGNSPYPLLRPDGSTLSTRITLGYDDADEDLYESVLESLSQDTVRGNLASPLERFVDYQDLKRRHEETPGLELLKRLEGILPRYRDTLCQIIRDPDTKLTMETDHVQLPADQADRYFRERQPHPPIQSVRETARVDGQTIPTSFTTSRVGESPKTGANRFVAQSIRRLQTCVDRIQRHLEEERKRGDLERHEGALRRLKDHREMLTHYASLLPYTPSEASHRFNERSAVTYYDGRYSRLRQLTNLLDALMDFVDASEDAIPFEVQAFNKAYEHWCFLQTIKALQALGFEFWQGTERHVTPFYRNPVPDAINAHMQHPSRQDYVLEVWYDREYPQLWRETGAYDPDRPYGLERRGLEFTDYRGSKRRPDIALEWHELGSRGKVIKGQPPRIITLDPTLRAPRPAMPESGRPPEDKYDYREAIRSFVEAGPDGKSRRIVDAAWGISPNVHAAWDHYTIRPASSHSYGFVFLRPEDKHRRVFKKTLETILRAAEWL